MKNNENNDNKQDEIITKIIDVDDLSNTFDKEDIESNLKYSILCYIGFLFLIPIINRKYKKSKYLLFHVNQGFNLFALELLLFVVLGFINNIFIDSLKSVPVWLSFINFVFYLIIVSLFLFGIVNSINGKSKEIPIIGKYRFIK